MNGDVVASKERRKRKRRRQRNDGGDADEDGRAETSARRRVGGRGSVRGAGRRRRERTPSRIRGSRVPGETAPLRRDATLSVSVAIAAVSRSRAEIRRDWCRRASRRRAPGDRAPRDRGKSREGAPSRLSRDFARTLPVGRAARARVLVARRRLGEAARERDRLRFRGRSARRRDSVGHADFVSDREARVG